MKAKITVHLKVGSAEEAQQLLVTLCEGLLLSGSIDNYQFEIETGQGIVTERCIFSEGKVIA